MRSMGWKRKVKAKSPEVRNRERASPMSIEVVWEGLMKKKRSFSKKCRRVERLSLAVAGIVVLAFMYWASRSTHPSSQTEAPGSMRSANGRAARIPPFHSSAEAAGMLPRTLPAGFRDPSSARAYHIAGQIPATLAQQPCYCWCDTYGHRSLLDCFISDHADG